jgi:hypothetical protein
MSLLGLLLILLLIGAIFGYGRGGDAIWIVLIVILVLALFGNFSYYR